MILQIIIKLRDRKFAKLLHNTVLNETDVHMGL